MVAVCHHCSAGGGCEEANKDVVLETHQAPQVSVARHMSCDRWGGRMVGDCHVTDRLDQW